jgi:Recombinase
MQTPLLAVAIELGSDRLSTFATVVASHLPPRAVAIPRPFKAAASSRSVLAPPARGVAKALNERGIVTARGGQWSASTVIDVLTRLA